MRWSIIIKNVVVIRGALSRSLTRTRKEDMNYGPTTTTTTYTGTSGQF